MLASGGIQETSVMHRSNTGLSNGAHSDFEVISQPSSVSPGQVPISLSQINPMGVSQTPTSMMDITLDQALSRVHDLSQENNELREHLKDNNEMIRKQYDCLSSWKKKVHDANVVSRDMFEQTKALIVGLRKDNEDLLEKISELETSKEDKMNELLLKIQSLESARLQSENIASQVRKQAEEQGMSIDDLDLNMQETVVVHVSAETETKISELEMELEAKNNEIRKLLDQNNEVGMQLRQFRGSTDQLLKDLEGHQQIKGQLERDNQELHEKNVDLNLQLQGLLTDTRQSMNLVEKVQLSTRSCNMSMEPSHVHRPDVEQQEVTRLREQISRSEEKYKTELSSLRRSQEQDKRKMDQLQAQVQDSERKLMMVTQRHEQEVVVLQRENEQKLMEIAQQHDTVKEQQLQSATYDSDIQSLRCQVLTLINEVHETQIKLSAATDAIAKKDRRLQEVEEKNRKLQMDGNQQRYEYQSAGQLLQQQRALMEQALAQERHCHDATKRSMGELRTSFEQLVTDYRDLLDTFDQYKLQQDRQAQNSVVRDERGSSERLSHLVAQLMAAEEGIAMRDEQIRSMKEELGSKKNEYEDMAAVFKAQAEVYKADFDAERAARETQVTDKNRVLQEMNDLQVKNQQLLDDIDTFSRRQMSEMQRRVAPPHNYPQNQGQYGPPANTGGIYRPPVNSMGLYGPPMPMPGAGYPYPPGGLSDVPGPLDSSYDETINLNHSNPSPGRIPDPEQHDEDDGPLVCPQCNMACPDMDTLQIHVIECLDKEEHRLANS